MTALQTPTLLSDSQLAPRLHEAAPYRIQLATRLPFYPVYGHELRYASTQGLALAETAGGGAALTDQTAQPDDPNQRFALVELATRFCLSYADQDVFSASVNEQVAVQHALATRRLLYRYWSLFESGQSSLGQFSGLEELVSPDRMIDLAGAPLTLEALECGKELVRNRDGRDTVILTSSLGKRAIHAAYWQRGVAPQYTPIDLPCPPNETVHETVLAFDGAPVYVNDLNRIVDGETGEPVALDDLSLKPDAGLATHIWFLSLGAHGLHGISLPLQDGAMFRTRATEDGRRTVTNYDVTLTVGLALASASAIGVLRNVRIPTGSGSVMERGDSDDA